MCIMCIKQCVTPHSVLKLVWYTSDIKVALSEVTAEIGYFEEILRIATFTHLKFYYGQMDLERCASTGHFLYLTLGHFYSLTLENFL